MIFRRKKLNEEEKTKRNESFQGPDDRFLQIADTVKKSLNNNGFLYTAYRERERATVEQKTMKRELICCQFTRNVKQYNDGVKKKLSERDYCVCLLCVCVYTWLSLSHTLLTSRSRKCNKISDPCKRKQSFKKRIRKNPQQVLAIHRVNKKKRQDLSKHSKTRGNEDDDWRKWRRMINLTWGLLPSILLESQLARFTVDGSALSLSPSLQSPCNTCKDTKPKRTATFRKRRRNVGVSRERRNGGDEEKEEEYEDEDLWERARWFRVRELESARSDLRVLPGSQQKQRERKILLFRSQEKKRKIYNKNENKEMMREEKGVRERGEREGGR